MSFFPGTINAALLVNDRFSKVYGNALEQPVGDGSAAEGGGDAGTDDSGAGVGAAEQDRGTCPAMRLKWRRHFTLTRPRRGWYG